MSRNVAAVKGLVQVARREGLATGRVRSRVYTRTGDAGSTSLYSGSRVRKSDPLVGALGDCDELTSSIGVAIEFCKASSADLGGLVARLVGIQSQVQQVNSLLATPSGPSSGPTDLDAFTEALEEAIDEMDAALPPLQEFILPSGGMESAHLQLSRAVCRRAERSLHRTLQLSPGEPAAPPAPFAGICKYLNRLSDFLFVSGRFACHHTGNKEATFKAPRSSGGDE